MMMRKQRLWSWMRRRIGLACALVPGVSALAGSQSADAELLKLRALVDRWRPVVNAQIFEGDYSPPLPRARMRVDAVSRVPDPKTSDYADCVIAVRLSRIDADSGGPVPPAEPTVPAAVLAYVWGFRGRQLEIGSKLKEGVSLDCLLLPESAMGPPVSRLQRVDDIEDLELPVYYAAHASLSDQPFVAFVPPGVLRDFAEPAPSREEAISRDRERIEARLAAYGSWDAWYEACGGSRIELEAKLAAAGEGGLVRDDRFFFATMAPLVEEPGEEWPEPQLRVLASLNTQLRERGVDLIVAPVPAKEHVNGVLFLEHPPADGVLNPYRQYLLKRLLDLDIEVLDLLPALVEGERRFPHVFYDARDAHPADGAIQITAEQIALRLRRYPLHPSYRILYRAVLRHGIPDKYVSFPQHARDGNAYSATRIFVDPLTPMPEASTELSPLLLLSDSFGGVPSSYGVLNANLSVHIAAQTGVLPRILRVGAGAPQMLVHLARSDPRFLQGVRVCILAFSERYLYRSRRTDALDMRWTLAELPPLADVGEGEAKPDGAVPVETGQRSEVE